MDGIMYLLNQAGIALAQANQHIAELEARVKQLEEAKEEQPDD